MKRLLASFTFLFLLGTSSMAGADADVGKCCQLDPGPTICGTCTQSQCGGSGGCSNCNASSVFQGQPGFEACTRGASPKMCVWELYEKYCQKWSKPKQGGRPPQSKVPGHGDSDGKVCLQWGSKFIKVTSIPCDQTLQSTDPNQTWVKK